MRKIQFAPGEYYHLFNRGVDDRKVFPNDFDFMRALVSLTVFNDEKSPPDHLSRFVKNPTELVDIIAFTFLPNHFHLFVIEKTENGISRFMHRLCKGYARYFNLKNERRGSLWQAAFGARHIDNEPYFIHMVSYVHLNILDLYYPGWRKGKIKNWEQTSSQLVSYPWSSYSYYRTGSSEIPFIELILTKPNWLDEYYPEPKVFEENLRGWSTRFLPFID